MILVDAPTSKVRVNHDLLDQAAQIFTRLIPLTAPEDRAVLAVCGQRVSLLSAIANKFDTATLTPQHYTVMLTKGDTQTCKSRPCFVELATQSKTGIPQTRAAHRRFTQISEGLRLRCVCRDCPLRPNTE